MCRPGAHFIKVSCVASAGFPLAFSTWCLQTPNPAVTEHPRALLTECQIFRVWSSCLEGEILHLVPFFLSDLHHWGLFICASPKHPHLTEFWLISGKTQVDCSKWGLFTEGGRSLEMRLSLRSSRLGTRGVKKRVCTLI